MMKIEKHWLEVEGETVFNYSINNHGVNVWEKSNCIVAFNFLDTTDKTAWIVYSWKDSQVEYQVIRLSGNEHPSVCDLKEQPPLAKYLEMLDNQFSVIPSNHKSFIKNILESFSK